METFPEETSQVQLQLVTATVKLFLKKPTEKPQQVGGPTVIMEFFLAGKIGVREVTAATCSAQKMQREATGA